MYSWIVVVDDDVLSLMNAKNLLLEQDVKVSCLRSGSNLLKFMEKNAPDLVLLDILMPDMDGFETYHKLREYEDEAGKKHVPVIFLTGENDSEIERRGLKAGASDFIRKPFNKDVLLRRVYNTIANSKKIESLTEEASLDKLTGFLNKAYGTEKIRTLCKDNTGALAILDLDNFKLVNDLFGHEMGDQVLMAFADVIRHNTRETDVVSRIGGDEVLVFFENIINEADIKGLCERFNAQLSERAAQLMGADHGIPLGLSMGAVMVPEYGRDYDSLFALADNSLYTVKQNGKHGYMVYAQKSFEERTTLNSPEAKLDRMVLVMQERAGAGGGMLLSRESLHIVYRYLERYQSRYGGKILKLLFVLSPGGGEWDRESWREMGEAQTELTRLLQADLRKCDLISQMSANEVIVFLPVPEDDGREPAETLKARILEKWKETRHGGHVKIDVYVKE